MENGKKDKMENGEKDDLEKCTPKKYEIPCNKETGEQLIKLYDFGEEDHEVMDAYVSQGAKFVLGLFAERGVEITDELCDALDKITKESFVLPGIFQGKGYGIRLIDDGLDDIEDGRLKDCAELLHRFQIRIDMRHTKKIGEEERKLIRLMYHGEEGDITRLGRIFARSHNTITAIVKDRSMSYKHNEKSTD